MLNPFVIAGLILTGVGLLQEAADDPKKVVKAIKGPAGEAGKEGKKGDPGETGKQGKTGKEGASVVKKPSDG